MGEIRELPNIGIELEKRLKEIGIVSSEELRQTGSKEAFFQIKLKDPEACLSMLCALEGAVQGIRWHNLSHEDKVMLKEYHKSL